jgi:hypothetical protein
MKISRKNIGNILSLKYHNELVGYINVQSLIDIEIRIIIYI